MTPTVMSEEVYAVLEPLQRYEAANGYPLRALCRAIGSMFLQAEEAARSQAGQPPYSQAWSVKRCPPWLLPFLGQSVGVKVVGGASPAAMRAQIEEEAAWKRGWLATLLSKVATTLTGTKRVRYVERNTTPWTLLIITAPEETPEPAVSERVAREWTPMGITPVTFALSSLPIIDEGTREIDKATEGTIDTATLAQVT
jgi:hypothetical protein